MVDTEWYKHAFDAGYIRRYAHRDQKEAEVFIDALISLFPISKDRRTALDVACGAGRHALALARRQFTVTGIDLSEDLIGMARRQALQQKLPATFFIRDMREPWPGDRYHLILNIFTSFGYFHSDSESVGIVLQASQKLLPDGAFALDTLNAEYTINNLVPKSSRIVDGTRLAEERWIKNRRVNKRTTLLDDNGQAIRSIEESVRLFLPEEIRRMIMQAGMKIRAEWGDYHGAVFTSDSPRFIVIATRV